MYEQIDVNCHGPLDDDAFQQEIIIFPFREVQAEEVSCIQQVKRGGQFFCELCKHPEVGSLLRCRPHVPRQLA